jgi:hypothetical protein
MCLLCWGYLAANTAQALPVINEILFNPPGTDSPNQYLELRGTPNWIFPDGSYFVAVEGDTNGNPGTVQNVFDLSGRMIGGNGCLVLLQKTNSYPVVYGSMVLSNSDTGTGFGSGSSSSIGHTGEGGQTDLEKNSATFFLIQTTNKPSLGADIDANNDGTPDGTVFPSWQIWDSVSVLDNDGLGDVAYGAITFRRNATAQGSGVVVPVNFTVSYVGRTGNTTGSLASDWVVADNFATNGSPPNWLLGSTIDTVPGSFAGMALNPVGGPNFGGPALPGVILNPATGSRDVAEGGKTDFFTLSLNTVPSGAVTIAIQCDGQSQVSTNGGTSYYDQLEVSLSNTAAVMITIRAVDDTAVESASHRSYISNRVVRTDDPVNYPTNTLIPVVRVNVTDNDLVLLNELKVNPPGTDEPFEFIELRGAPNAALTNVYLAIILGDKENNPGTSSLVFDLTSNRLGTNGLLLIMATNNPYSVAAGTTVAPDHHFNKAGGCLDNGTVSFLLLTANTKPDESADLDNGDNSILEGLPGSATILDAVGWSDGGSNDLVYGSVVLSSNTTPDAVARFPGNNTPLSAAAWFYGELQGTNGNSLGFDEGSVSSNFPPNAPLTPGEPNNTVPSITPLGPICGTIGDPTNPKVYFTVADAETTAGDLLVVASSSQSVVPNTNLTLTSLGNGQWALAIEPKGVGYAAITVSVSDGTLTRQVSFDYAASLMERAGGRFHSGAADASTAIAVDDNYMLVGDDENQVLRLYPRNFSGLPVWQTNITPFLGLTDIENGVPREVDIEANTRVGNRIFWLGAHSNSSLAEGRTNRSRMFVTDLSGTGTNISLTYIGRYDYLKLDLANWDATNGHEKGSNYYGLMASTAEGVDSKTPGGFNIEGLAMAPGSTNVAYLGLRAPIGPATNRVFALIIPVTNFTDLAASAGPPGSARFGTPIELDLFGRGIRSIEGSPDGYLIVAGTPMNVTGKYPDDFKLYIWTGLPGAAPQEFTADLSMLNPEGIVELPPGPWTSNTVFQLISDNGAKVWYGDGVQAKHLPTREFRKFRSDWVRLGNSTAQAPILQSATWASNTVTLKWRAAVGHNYSIGYKTNLHDFTWQTLTNSILSPSTQAIFTDFLPAPPRRFYRIGAN